ncbi:DUF63 family protein [Candidatus Micrarchaeota archaeon]|nr:DUF63 family protein [Candidatus Micrarchaeota archaeon]
MDIFNEFFIEPIIMKTGYNIVNTLVYALIAVVSVYFLFYLFKKNRISIDWNFVKNILPFIFFGSTMRVVTDAIDAGVFQPITPLHEFILSSHIYDYGFVTVSPGIYILTAVITLFSVFLFYRINKPEYVFYTGTLLFLFHLLLLIPFMGFILHAIPVIILAAIPLYLSYIYFRNKEDAMVVGAHALDGAATFYIIDIFSGISGKTYFEQHVFPRFLGEFAGTYFGFYLVKVLLPLAAVYLIRKERMQSDEKTYILLILMIIGLAPGMRDLLRMVIGT